MARRNSPSIANKHDANLKQFRATTEMLNLAEAPFVAAFTLLGYNGPNPHSCSALFRGMLNRSRDLDALPCTKKKNDLIAKLVEIGDVVMTEAAAAHRQMLIAPAETVQRPATFILPTGPAAKVIGTFDKDLKLARDVSDFFNRHG